jgi:2-polyprenyl-3-methyl-5-hydroxy-6-metoxy-1,4-benzoquinol methylase
MRARARGGGEALHARTGVGSGSLDVGRAPDVAAAMQLLTQPGVAARPRAQRPRSAVCAGSAASTRPAWAGDDLLSQVVNMAIASPLYSLMKPLARNTLIQTAETNGIPWRGEVSRLSSLLPQLEALQAELAKPIPYPAYYTVPFHAYEDGNLNWLAAEEAESATYSMACRVYPAEVKAGTLDWRGAQTRLRESFTGALAAFMTSHGCPAPSFILDVGCSVGLSTRALGAAFPTCANVVGLDLSTYMLAVAALRDSQPSEHQPAPPPGQRREWRHGLAEKTELEDESVDIYSAAFLHHELPQEATRDVLAEAFRVLRPGGCYVMTDNNPASPVCVCLRARGRCRLLNSSRHSGFKGCLLRSSF